MVVIAGSFRLAARRRRRRRHVGRNNFCCRVRLKAAAAAAAAAAITLCAEAVRARVAQRVAQENNERTCAAWAVCAYPGEPPAPERASKRASELTGKREIARTFVAHSTNCCRAARMSLEESSSAPPRQLCVRHRHTTAMTTQTSSKLCLAHMHSRKCNKWHRR